LALLVVDVQAAFLPAMAHGDRFLRRCELAVRAARLLGLPIFFTEQVPHKLGPTHPDLLQSAGEGAAVFPKTTFSAWAVEGLVQACAERSIEHLLICGLEGPVCVYQTALAAQQALGGVTILSDAVTERRPEDTAVCWTTLRGAGVQVLPTETVFYALLGGAQHPQFRAFTDLIKRA
jgi:nicotinamidase-related amidase